jgi:hypothetical protein
MWGFASVPSSWQLNCTISAMRHFPFGFDVASLTEVISTVGKLSVHVENLSRAGTIFLERKKKNGVFTIVTLIQHPGPFNMVYKVAGKARISTDCIAISLTPSWYRHFACGLRSQGDRNCRG